MLVMRLITERICVFLAPQRVTTCNIISLFPLCFIPSRRLSGMRCQVWGAIKGGTSPPGSAHRPDRSPERKEPSCPPRSCRSRCASTPPEEKRARSPVCVTSGDPTSAEMTIWCNTCRSRVSSPCPSHPLPEDQRAFFCRRFRSVLLQRLLSAARPLAADSLVACRVF